MAEELTKTAQILEGDFAVAAKAMRTMSETRYPSWDFDDLVVAPDRAEMTFDLKLITPMIGGGARPGRPDQFWPIRSSAIRGHLRFWWRALQTEATRLKEREGELWGSSETPGRVSLSVRVAQRGDVRHLHDRSSSVPAYVRGVLVEPRETPESDRYQYLQGTRFKLTVDAREHKEEVERAVLAWIGFGGLGARIRRGAGSIGFQSGGALNQDSLRRLLGPSSASPLGLTTLQGATLFLGPGCSDPIKAWLGASVLLEGFRKGVNASGARSRIQSALRDGSYASYPGGPRHHSPWIEADSIRALRGERTLRNRPSMGGKLHLPRARLGMPFTVRMMRNHAGFVHPGSFETKNQSGDLRLASPAIVKAIQIGNEYRSALLILKQPMDAKGITLSNVHGEITFKPSIPPDGSGLSPADDVRLMLAEYARQIGWTEVRA